MASEIVEQDEQTDADQRRQYVGKQNPHESFHAHDTTPLLCFAGAVAPLMPPGTPILAARPILRSLGYTVYR